MGAWPAVRLDNCCRIVSGATPSTGIDEYWDGDICWATPKDLSELDGALISDTPRKITPAGLASCAAEILPPGSVLFSSRAPIGHVAINAVPMATNQGFKSFVPNSEKVDARFLYWWLKTNRAYLESLGNGATFKEVSKAVVSRVQIPLPSLNEQRRIADVLDAAQALRVRRCGALDKLDELSRAILLDLLGERSESGAHWQERQLGEVATFVRGVTFKPDQVVPVGTPGSVACLRTKNVQREVDLTDVWGVPDALLRREDQQLRHGDILISSANSWNLVGRCCWIPELPWRSTFGGFVTVLRGAPGQIEARYLYEWFALDATQARVRSFGQQTTNIANLNLERCRQLAVPLPPLGRQRDFVRRIESVDQLREVHRTALGHVNALVASLQHRAFRGEL